MNQLFISLISVVLVIITNVNIEPISKIETFKNYREQTKEMVINNVKESVKILWDEDDLRYVYLLKGNNENNEQYIKKVKLYETILKELCEEDEVEFLLQVLIWNVETFDFHNVAKEQIQLRYSVDNEAINDVYKQILVEMSLDESNQQIELDETNVQQEYVVELNKQKIGPYKLNSKIKLTEFTYEVYKDDEIRQVIAYDRIYSEQGFYFEHDQFMKQDLSFQLFQKQYDLIYIEQNEDKKQKHFYFNEIEDKVLFQKNISLLALVGAFQIQFVTNEHKPLKNTVFELINSNTGETVTLNVNVAGTQKIDELIPGVYQLLYSPNDVNAIEQGVIDNIIITPKELTKITEEVRQIIGMIVLNLQATNKKAVELYEYRNEQKVFKQRFELIDQTQYIISDLASGEYVLKFLLDNYEDISEEINFSINNDVQFLEYDILETEHKLLVETGENRIFQLIGCVMFIISIGIMILLKIRKHLVNNRMSC